MMFGMSIRAVIGYAGIGSYVVTNSAFPYRRKASRAKKEYCVKLINWIGRPTSTNVCTACDCVLGEVDEVVVVYVLVT